MILVFRLAEKWANYTDKQTERTAIYCKQEDSMNNMCKMLRYTTEQIKCNKSVVFELIVVYDNYIIKTYLAETPVYALRKK